MQIEHPTSPPFSLRPVSSYDLATGPEPDQGGEGRASQPETAEGDHAAADEGDPAIDPFDRPLTPERRLLCMIVRQLTHELLQAVGLDSDSGGRRRAAGHVRQVAMYVCHVAYSMPMGEVAQAFGRDRSTVGHACRIVEDRRDDAAYDGFVTIVERMASAVYLLAGRRP
ncbi:helix-turn-helix domain-containing protein [Rhizobium sp. AG855]|uniref:helix-turn-helix domain-containing protein n=1 Tax=Rhizobium sp. AG855 TaxID=2183898 RepID=UPI000FED250B|nr:helix-turn-helix domain-containing protein [Rhizobium sp. AG855]RKE85613.1 DnaA-like protein [Rhizobium sp. AG855]